MEKFIKTVKTIQVSCFVFLGWIVVIGFIMLMIQSCKEKQEIEVAELTAQTTVETRFAKPRVINDKYVVDVECKSAGNKLFAMNVRFCYDASVFTNVVTLKNFSAGYGTDVFGQPQVWTGSDASKVMLGFNGAMSCVNGAIQMTAKDSVKTTLDNWSKIMEVELTTKKLIDTCQALVWDKMSNTDLGGFLRGSEGLTVTVLAPQGSRYESLPSKEVPTQANWEYTGSGMKGVYPYGKPKACK